MTTEAPLGLRETLENAIENTETSAPEVTPEETSIESSRARDEKGRFASAQEEPEVEQEPEVMAEAEPAPQVKQSPKSWKKDVADKYWNSLSPELQDEILRREDAAVQGMNKYRSDAQVAAEFKQVVEPFREYIESLGATPTVAIERLLNTEYRLRNGTPYEKAQTFMQLAQAYGVNMGELATQRPDPSYQLQNELSQLRGMYENLIQTQQRSQEQQVLSEIEQFAATHEHLDTVREDMAFLLNEGRARDLEDAYNKAIRLHDDLFTQIQQPSQRREEANRAAQAAKKAAVSVKGSRSGVSGQAPTGNLRDLLEKSFDGRL